jgi:hypothetical protein
MFKIRYFFLALVLVAANSCSEEEPTIKAKGFLSLEVSAISIDSSPAGGRTKVVSTDDFIVKIFRVGEDDPTVVFDPWSSAPAEIELETGEYYAEAQNLEAPAPAAFDLPWYYGTSENFTIDKEELKTIEVAPSMANFKVAFHYSENVAENFTIWTSTATRSGSGQSLAWLPGDSREGYFLTGEPLAITVHLEYQKQFEEGVITRDFETTINTPLAATLYKLNVDAVLEDGKIQLQIDVDDSFETVEIEVGEDEEGG